jgi:AraC-like DNA-binding protein
MSRRLDVATPNPTCAVRLLAPFTKAVLAKAPQAQALLAVVMSDPDLRVPHAQSMELLRHSQTICGEEIGLLAAQQMGGEVLDVLEYVALSSETPRAAVENVARYLRLMHDAAELTLRMEDQETAVVAFRFTGDLPMPLSVAEFVLASVLFVGHRLVGQPVPPKAVHFTASAPHNVALREQLFGCPVLFDQAENAIIARRSAMEAANPRADSSLQRIVLRHAAELVERLPVRKQFSDQLREHIIGHLRGGPPSIERISELVHMSPRTIHRRLAEENISYRDVVDDVRRDLARGYLQESELSLGEIAFLLGFSHVNAFHRAFRRWTGQTPAEARVALVPKKSS